MHEAIYILDFNSEGRSQIIDLSKIFFIKVLLDVIDMGLGPWGHHQFHYFSLDLNVVLTITQLSPVEMSYSLGNPRYGPQLRLGLSMGQS